MWKVVLISMMAALLAGCDFILDELYDCLDDDGPVFDAGQLPPAVLNQYYSFVVIASIDNEPDDDRFNYTISLQGRLPAGLNLYRYGNDRTIIISGIPTEAGVFNVTLHVEVSDPYSSVVQSGNYYDDGDDLCRTTHSQSYSLVVTL
jgi:hypothetical protein